ncbi:riboflavin biosynthesis protein RibD [Citricoccus zhacaiensis]|uniref:Riboflavin biosynthesis protein RibD n=1 Tax=Citricoccus zhacaiensis TaxID=489142 RepID=A0ABQ2M7I4_9MICC|nr:bifunctional diaminohydroxyphosphoribosylaminopyrimidine deaminase/5-amino-6-(5-phosphoribosylamino)uracil reductase RibD [Citricoccus zhacaiensis]GGO47845.1 riboflavin biosynthesis protein RibD [Citricoccus zhacaiensis]
MSAFEFDGTTVAGPEEALALAVAQALRGIRGANPLVGAIITASDGRVLASGYHRGRGTAHAEVEALAGFNGPNESTRINPADATLWITLEPCDHTGTTGPCTEAILASGIRRVRYAVADPTGPDGGGAARLRSAGLDVQQVDAGQVRRAGADDLNRRWTLARDSGRPFVTAHLAQSLDGRVAAADGTSQWITGPESRRHAHRVRSRVDAIIVGTGTVLADDPRLTARDEDGHDLPLQPVPVVQGRRAVPAGAALRGGASWLHVESHDPQVVLDQLTAGDPGHVLIEGGPTVLSAWMGAGLVDELFLYQAPLVLGSGPTGLDLPQLTTLPHALRLTLDAAENGAISRLGDDVLLHYAAP